MLGYSNSQLTRSKAMSILGETEESMDTHRQRMLGYLGFEQRKSSKLSYDSHITESSDKEDLSYVSSDDNKKWSILRRLQGTPSGGDDRIVCCYYMCFSFFVILCCYYSILLLFLYIF